MIIKWCKRYLIKRGYYILRKPKVATSYSLLILVRKLENDDYRYIKAKTSRQKTEACDYVYTTFTFEAVRK